ncbi:hypothetical protein SAY87_027050 [Trapa incisa]|uniref:Pentatricopeptide repeat-containing protein n=1 Tax=Trapa incisa TaxID=236973 RepID=A0AAN7JEL0_9MYRT|nr:hypothetical protein SAY87_027050 [Trapa incisa]
MLLGLSNLNQLIPRLLERCSLLIQLKQIQAFLLVRGHGDTQFFAFKLVRFCTIQLSHLNYARLIFDSLRSPNIYLCTAMITAYASRPEQSSAAFLLFRDMVRNVSPRPDHFIYPHVLKSCSRPPQAEIVHGHILKSGFGEYSVVQTALLDCYSRSASGLESARFLFDEMCDRTIVSWTAMVSGYIRLGKIEEAVVLFEEMPERDVPSWNALIAGCTQNGLFSRALSILRSMIGCSTSEEGQLRGNRPNAITVACALSACGHSGTLQLGKEIHGYILRNDLGVDPYLSNALIDMYGKCASLNDAMMIFDKTAKRNLTSWNSMINCLAFHGQTSHAISIFEDMMLSGDDILPDEVTFIGLLNACTHGGEVERGKAYFEAMARDYNLQPCIQHYGCLIDLLGRAGKFEEALEVVRGMKIQPDEVIWGALLNGSRLHGRIDLAEVAVGKLIELDPDNGGYRTMLANIYGEQGKWEEVRRVRKILKEQDSYKTPGCSWVEINSQLHQFYSVDLTHSRTDEIYATLESLVDVC